MGRAASFAVIARRGRVHFTVPVVAQPEHLDLTPERVDVPFRGDARMDVRLHRVPFRRQSEGVPSHRMQHMEPAHPLIARDDIGRGVPFRMSDVQPRSRGIGIHVEHEQFGLRRQGFRPERLVVVPVLLPFLFNRAEGVRHRVLPFRLTVAAYRCCPWTADRASPWHCCRGGGAGGSLRRSRLPAP